MSRKIDHDKKYSEEDKEYLRQRGEDYRIPANDRRFGPDAESEPETDEDEDELVDEDISKHVEGLKVQELKDELEKLGVEIAKDDLKEDLQEKLANHLQDQRDEENKK